MFDREAAIYITSGSVVMTKEDSKAMSSGNSNICSCAGLGSLAVKDPDYKYAVLLIHIFKEYELKSKNL